MHIGYGKERLSFAWIISLIFTSVVILFGCGPSITEQRTQFYNRGLVGKNYSEVASFLNSEERTVCIPGKFKLGVNGGRCLQQPEFRSTGSFTMRWYGPVRKTFYSAGPNSRYELKVYYEDVHFNNGVCVNAEVGEIDERFGQWNSSGDFRFL